MTRPCANCPSCGSTDVRPTLASNAGSYCACDTCGHLWHQDAQAATGRSPEDDAAPPAREPDAED